MKGNRAALRYAKAVLSLAREKNVAEEVNADMTHIKGTIAASADLRVLITSPVIKDTIKKDTLSQVFTSTNGITRELFKVLLENNRINLLGLVALNYTQLFDEMNNVQVAKVTSAIALSPALEEKIQAKVKELTGNAAKIENKVDESIIGGFILRVGDLQYNASIAAQLNNLKREFTNNTYVSKFN